MATRRLLTRRLEVLERREVLSATIFEHDGVAYFLNQSDPGFDRYDIAAEEWMAPVDLAGAVGLPTAAHVDDDGIYVAYGTSVYRYGLDGSGQTAVLNTQSAVQRIHTDGNLLFLNYSSSLYARLASVNKTTNTVIDTMDSYIDAVGGSSIDTQSNKIFGRSIGVSPSDITYVTYSDNGDLLSNGDSPYHGDYPGANETWVFDDGTKVVDNSGTIYTTALQYAGSFGGAIKDIDFVGGQIPVVLAGSTVTAYSTGLLPTGSASVTGNASALFVNDQSALVFGGAVGGWGVTVVPLSSLNAPKPGEAVNPVGLPFTPDKLEIAADGTVLLFSKQHASVFRYDPVAQLWGDTIPLVGAPLYMAYSRVNNVVYLAYDTGLIRAIDLDDPALESRPFATVPSRPYGLATAGEFVFSADASGAWESHYTFSPDGTMISAVDWNYGAAQYTWSEVNRKMYFFRDGTSPNDILWETITESGSIGAKIDSPLHSSAGFTYPIRVSPDGAVAILGSGMIHDATTLARLPQALGNPVSDIAWLGGDTYTIRTVAGVAQLQSWTGVNWGLDKVMQLPGTALALTAVGDDRLLAITRAGSGAPMLTILDGDFNVIARPTPVAIASADVRVDLGSSTTLDGSASYDPDESPAGLTYSWSVVEGPADAVFGDSTAAITSFTADTAGEYLVELRVSDGEYTSTDLVTVTYRLNLAPNVDATGSTLNGVAGRPAIALTAAASTDPNGDPLQFAWELITAPDGATGVLTAASGLTNSFAADLPGAYQVRLTASDGALEDSEVLTLTFAANQAPTPDASLSDLTGVAGRHAAVLNAGASTDPEGDALSYRWEAVAGPNLAAVTISGMNSPVANFSSTVAGVYDVRLTANDGLATASTVVRVTIAENQKPVADASLSTTQIVFGGSSSVRLDGTASSDPDDAAISYAWRVVASSNGATPSIGSSTRSVAYLYPTEPGVYAIELRVSDGASSDTDFVIITVLGNQAPTADASASDQVIVVGGDARLDASRSFDPDGDELTYAWSVVASASTPAPTIADPGASKTQLIGPGKGSHLIRLLVSDGTTSEEDFALVTVRERFQHPWTGDVTGDGWVNSADYTALRDLHGKSVTPFTSADATGDGWINDDDVAVWRASYGANPGAEAAATPALAQVEAFVSVQTPAPARDEAIVPLATPAAIADAALSSLTAAPQPSGRASTRDRAALRAPFSAAELATRSRLLLARDAAVLTLSEALAEPELRPATDLAESGPHDDSPISESELDSAFAQAR